MTLCIGPVLRQQYRLAFTRFLLLVVPVVLIASSMTSLGIDALCAHYVLVGYFVVLGFCLLAFKDLRQHV